ncbi:MAG: NUDIX domain-containing protein [Bacteroidales bacterium]|jgi:ADP-ribose pyrophosphatase YjhB (NUDIX family)
MTVLSVGSSGYNYPKHLVAVDCIIFGYKKETLKLLLAPRKYNPGKDQWSLMGGWLDENETLEEAAKRVLFQISGLKDIFLEQVHGFSDPYRDSGGRVISVAFYAMIRINRQNMALVEKLGAKWWDFNNKPGLVFDHDKMVEYAHNQMKLKASYELIGRDLLPEKFTILQLRKLYEAIYQKEIDPANFRKKVLSLRILRRLDEKNTTDSKKGAFFYRFRKTEENENNGRILKIY